MLLVLVNTSGGKEILTGLKNEGIEPIVMLPSVYDAGLYGIDNVIAGSMEAQRMQKIIAENNITAVIDALDNDEREASSVISFICSEKNIPLFKYVLTENDYSNYKNARVFENSFDVAEVLNSDNSKVFVFGDEVHIKRVAEKVSERQNLYRIVPKGEEMDVEFSVNSGIPLANLLAVESISDVEEVSRVMKTYGIGKFICCESPTITETLEFAKKIGIEAFIVKKEYPKYYTQIATVDKMLDAVKTVVCKEAEPSDNDGSSTDANFENNAEVTMEGVNSVNSQINNIEDMETLQECRVPKSKVVNRDGTINMSEFVKYVKHELNIEK